MNLSEKNTQQKKTGMVAIVGRPNAGKSTLLNRVMGSTLSIVSPKAQTTREMVRGILTEEKGQIVFLDTPGIHRAKAGGINESMVFSASQALEDPDAVWYLVDPTARVEHEALVIQAMGRAAKSERQPKVFLILTKSDERAEPEHASLLDDLTAEIEKQGFKSIEVIQISAKKKHGIKALMEQTWSALPFGEALYPDVDQLSDRPVRFFVAEMVREQLFRQLGDELPYSCAVNVTQYQEQPKIIRIEADIVVERDSQKGMVIGQGGKKIKEVGSAARVKVEAWLGQKVYLGLRLKVVKNWTKNPSVLEDMGYVLPSGRRKHVPQTRSAR